MAGRYIAMAQGEAALLRSDGKFAQLAHALRLYHAAHGCFPPTVYTTADGHQHSWRVALLPFLDRSELELYQRYDFSDSWDGTKNSALRYGEIPGFYACPRAIDATQTVTCYLSYSAGGKWPLRDKPLRAYTVSSGPDHFTIVEVRMSDVHWMEPRDTVMSGPH
jgi:hypothetical protein